VGDDDAVERSVRERQRRFVGEGDEICGLAGPGDHALLGWHQGDQAFGFALERLQIGRGEAQA
jgi:hypothetical protein